MGLCVRRRKESTPVGLSVDLSVDFSPDKPVKRQPEGGIVWAHSVEATGYQGGKSWRRGWSHASPVSESTGDRVIR